MRANKPGIDSPLSGKVVALPESRQLDVLVDLFARRGAEVMRVPLIAILDAPDQRPLIQWLQAFIKSPPDYFIILTGEGLRRLHSTATRQKLADDFVAALGKTCKICRGPKPGRVLREWGLAIDIPAQAPTTPGIIATLQTLSLAGKHVAVQLYGEDPNLLLQEYLQQQALGSCTLVAPYIYASEVDTERVKTLIQELAAGQVDLIAFTSQPQVRRLFDVATRHHQLDELQAGLAQTRVAAIGPVVADLLSRHGCRVDIMPAKSFFMKPLVAAAEMLFGED